MEPNHPDESAASGGLEIDRRLRTKPARTRDYYPLLPNLLMRTEAAALREMAEAIMARPKCEPQVVFQVAGLHNHGYCRSIWDTPLRGGRLELVHNPDNPEDSWAVEVRFNYQIMGHAPADVAWVLGPLLADGMVADAWVIDPGNGYSWSMEVLLLGDAAWAVQETRRVEE